jgi:hypothetical protein
LQKQQQQQRVSIAESVPVAGVDEDMKEVGPAERRMSKVCELCAGWRLISQPGEKEEDNKFVTETLILLNLSSGRRPCSNFFCCSSSTFL